MGYKRAGFEVIGNVEIDKKISRMYCANHHPKYNYNMDLREFNKIEELPEELYHLDILDGSPPCTTFSMAGKRENTWGKTKKFREGQAEQTLDDLFFVFLDTVEKLQPKVVVAENVTGLLSGNARGYVNQIVKRFREIGYDVQIFSLNAARMDVPQARPRAIFVANNQNYPKLNLKFDNTMIPFGAIREEHGKPANSKMAELLEQARPTDTKLEHVIKRVNGKGQAYYSSMIVHDDRIAPTITSGGNFFRFCDKTLMSDKDIINAQTFPQDYDFCGNSVQYVCGMSVPPNMMANIAMEIWKQWLSR